jgi:predicted phage terminase large subunit-like protein
MMIPDRVGLGALLRQDFGLFLRFAFSELGGGRAYQHNWHIDAIEHQLNRVQLGDNRRLIVTMPPRHLKSVTISTAWVAWMIGSTPSKRFMCVSYGYDLAEKHARDCLRLMDTDWYRLAFPNLRLTRRSVLDFETHAGGGRLSTSVGGVITGRGADIIVIDDPMKADDALSEAARDANRDWLYTSLLSRLDDQERSSIILVMQRLHEADLAGELIRSDGWDELRLSALATHDELIPLTRGRYHQRRTGCALHPARQSQAFLEHKRAQESYIFAAQYQQEPVAPVGAFVTADWFGIYDTPPRTGIVVQSWDTAVKKTVRSDWSVGITAVFYQGRFYILDLFRGRVSFSELVRQVRESCLKHQVDRLLIEDASSGQQLIQQLREQPLNGVPFPIGVSSTVDKVTRFEAQASKIQSGVVVLPRAAPWLADFVGELTGFPGGLHDDQADALAQMLANAPSHYPTIPIAGPEIVDPESWQNRTDEDVDPWAGY